MAQDSKLPSGEELSRPMIAYLQMIESRVPSNTTPVDAGATLPELIARFNQLLLDMNKQ
jgi:hypothetical protein